MLTGAFPSRSGRSLFNSKNKLGGDESAYGTAARMAGLPARTRPTTTARRSMLTSGPRQSASTSGQTTFRTHQSLRSIDPESPGEPREGDNLRAAPNPTSRPTEIRRYRLRHVPALPVAGSALGRRNPRARTLGSPSASVTGPCLCRPCPSPARAALFLLSGLLVFPLSCEGKTHQTISERNKHTMTNSTFNRETNWRTIRS